jgi:hypothetical protein
MTAAEREARQGLEQDLYLLQQRLFLWRRRHREGVDATRCRP